MRKSPSSWGAAEKEQEKRGETYHTTRRRMAENFACEGDPLLQGWKGEVRPERFLQHKTGRTSKSRRVSRRNRVEGGGGKERGGKRKQIWL